MVPVCYRRVDADQGGLRGVWRDDVSLQEDCGCAEVQEDVDDDDYPGATDSSRAAVRRHHVCQRHRHSLTQTRV